MTLDTLLVNPAEVNLADVKAMAAKHGADVVGSRYIPRGVVFLVDSASTAAKTWSDGA